MRTLALSLLFTLVFSSALTHAQSSEEGESTPVDHLVVELGPLPDAWSPLADPEAPVQMALGHAELDASLKLIVLDAADFDDDVPLTLLATDMLLSWDEQFRVGGPTVTEVEHDLARVLAGLTGIYGHLRFRGRVGLYFGFTSHAVAEKLGLTIDHDRFAYFLLLEGPVSHEDALLTAFSQALEGLECHL